MYKKLLSLLLAFAMVLSLAGCGAKTSQGIEDRIGTVSRTYASTAPLDPFQTLEAVSKLKDMTFDLHVSTLKESDNTPEKEILTVSGEWYSTTRQAAFTAFLEEGTSLTTAVLDGADFYIDAKTAAQGLAARYKTLTEVMDNEDMAADLESIAGRIPADYVQVPLREDPWTTLEGSGYAGVKENLLALLSGLKTDVGGKVRTNEADCTLTVGDQELQTALLNLLGGIEEQEQSYYQFFGGYLEDNVQRMLGESGWGGEELIESFLFPYMVMKEEQEAQKADKKFKEWTVRCISAGDEQGYSIDFTKVMDDGRNYWLNVYPAEPVPVTPPESSVNYESCAGDLVTVYMDTFLLWNDAYGTPMELSMEEQEFEEQMEDGEEMENVYTELSTTPIDGYKRIVKTPFCTLDDVGQEIPIVKEYAGAELSEYLNDLLIYSNGFIVQYSSVEIDGRTPKQDAKEAVQEYVSIFRDDFGYDITQDASKPTVAGDGSAAAAGMSYFDSSEDREVAVITGAIQAPEESEYLITFDFFIYKESISKTEAAAIEELLNYLGLELPIELL